MKTNKILNIGFIGTQDVEPSLEKFLIYFTSKNNVHGQVLVTFADYFVKYLKLFDKAKILISYNMNQILPNGTATGLLKTINSSEVDIIISPVRMWKATIDVGDFSYPYEIVSYSFVTSKPVYKPETFGIFQTFSMSVWVSIVFTLFAVFLVNYATQRTRYSFDKIFLHVFAIFLRQSSILKLSSFSSKILLYAWIVGAMFICLAYESVILSFLSFPPVFKIRNLTELASAVVKGDYHCMHSTISGLIQTLLDSDRKSLKIIATDMDSNNLNNGDPYTDFIHNSRKQNLAYITDTLNLGIFVGKYFVSKDRFHESMGAIMTRKDFCCKKQIEVFVHRLMASGLYFKYWGDYSFLIGLPLSLKTPESDSDNRKLTLTDVSPAFIFLLIGYFISVLVFIWEIVTNRKRKKSNNKKFKKPKNKKIQSEISV